MNKYQEITNKLISLCHNANCDLVVKYNSHHEIVFKCVDENESQENVFRVIIYYPTLSTKAKENWNEEKEKFYSTRLATFEINSCYDDYSGGQFSRKDIELLLSLDDLTDEELGIKKPDFPTLETMQSEKEN